MALMAVERYVRSVDNWLAPCSDNGGVNEVSVCEVKCDRKARVVEVTHVVRMSSEESFGGWCVDPAAAVVVVDAMVVAPPRGKWEPWLQRIRYSKSFDDVLDVDSARPLHRYHHRYRPMHHHSHHHQQHHGSRQQSLRHLVSTCPAWHHR